MKKVAGFLVLSLMVSGCAGARAQRKLQEELNKIVSEAVKNNESCTTLCIKLKQVIAEKLNAK